MRYKKMKNEKHNKNDHCSVFIFSLSLSLSLRIPFAKNLHKSSIFCYKNGWEKKDDRVAARVAGRVKKK